MNSSTLKLTALGVAVVLVLALIFYKQKGTKTEPPQGAANQSLPGANEGKVFTLSDMGGKTVSLTEYKGKVVFVNFWGTWCGPCRSEIPDLIELYRQYKDKGFEILAISINEQNTEAVKSFADTYKINYKILVNGESVAGAYGVSAVPTTVIIDRQGNVRNTLIGARSRSDFEAALKPLL